MRDKGRIAVGLVIFLIIMTFPFWFDLVKGVNPMPDPIIATKDVPGKNQCVRSTEYMKTSHMDLLNQWRDEVVRRDDRFARLQDGRVIEKSLSNTCLDCHSNKQDFCDRCHNRMAVSPYCWDCHLTPDETRADRMALNTALEGDVR